MINVIFPHYTKRGEARILSLSSPFGQDYFLQSKQLLIIKLLISLEINIVCPTFCIQFIKEGMNITNPLSTVRYVVAYVFITSGVMKLFSSHLAEVFINLGLPYPKMMLYVTAFMEIICGILILLNRSVKNAVIPLIGIMIAAILLTKIPSINTGILQFAFNARLDIVMIVMLILLYLRSPN